MASPAAYAHYYQAAAQRYGVPASTLAGLVTIESGGNPNARSPVGAQGLTQFMPGTAKSYGVQFGSSPAAIQSQIFGAAHYLSALGYAKNPRLALSSYNAGPGNPGAAGPYAANVLAAASKYAHLDRGGGGSGTAARAIPGVAAPQSVSEQVPTFNQAAYQKANAKYIAGSFISGQKNPFDIGPKGADVGPNPLFSPGALTTTAPNVADYQGTKTIRLAQNGLQALAGGTQLHPHPAVTAAMTSKLPKGVVQFAGKPVAAWIAPILAYAQKHGWHGSVTSGYRTLAQQTQIYNSGVRPAAKPGTSNHEMDAFPGGAVDVSDAQQLSQILAKSPYASLLVYAGSKDPVHFSHPHNGSY